VKKKAPLTAIQFNALAIVTLLAFMPFAIAFITSAGSNTSTEYTSSTSPWARNEPIPYTDAVWYHTGENYTGIYESNIPMPYNWYECAYVSYGDCLGPTDPSNAFNTEFSQLSPAASYLDYRTYFMNQNMKTFLVPGEYLGSSGSGPFGWLLDGSIFNNIEQNTSLDEIKYSFFDPETSYACDYVGFTDLNIESSITLIYGNESLRYDGFKSIQENKKEMRLYDNSNGHWSDECANFLELAFDFTGFESLAIDDMNGGDWANTTHLIEIKSISRTDGAPIADTPLPFAGDYLFAFYAEHQEIDPVQAGFIIKSLTTLLSAGTFLLALASTQYWNPVSKRVKGGF